MLLNKKQAMRLIQNTLCVFFLSVMLTGAMRVQAAELPDLNIENDVNSEIDVNKGNEISSENEKNQENETPGESVNKNDRGDTQAKELIDKRLKIPQFRMVNRKGKGAVLVKWDKITNAAGYQIQYATKASFKGSSLKTVKISKGSRTSKSISGISGKKDTYIRIRAYRKKNGKKSYSKWSAPVRLIYWKSNWKYAWASQLHSNQVTMYYSTAKKPKNITVAINAGHGTRNGSAYRTLCHPDGTAKVTGGSTAQGATYAAADNTGTTMLNGTPEAVITLRIAESLKKKLLSKGYNVLMVRQDDDSGLDVIGRTVFANNCADCHIAIHFDSSTSDKGAFYCSVPDNVSYRNMSPVSGHWKQHISLGDCLIRGLRNRSVKIWSSGAMPTDLMQTSFSTVPSVDIEMGDRATSVSEANIDRMANGLLKGIQYYFQ